MHQTVYLEQIGAGTASVLQKFTPYELSDGAVRLGRSETPARISHAP
jgi:hypothetical protein